MGRPFHVIHECQIKTLLPTYKIRVLGGCFWYWKYSLTFGIYFKFSLWNVVAPIEDVIGVFACRFQTESQLDVGTGAIKRSGNLIIRKRKTHFQVDTAPLQIYLDANATVTSVISSERGEGC